jgi:hypothetical protein
MIVDDQHIEIAIVVGIEEGSIHRVSVEAAAIEPSVPLEPSLALPKPQLGTAGTQEYHVHVAIGIDIAPQRCHDAGHLSQCGDISSHLAGWPE